MRLDKWLWAARFFKTRSLAQQAIESGRVTLNDQRIKPAHVLKISDFVSVRVGDFAWRIQVRKLSERRGPATEARTLYDETAQSRAERERRVELRRWSAEPAADIKGRPTKRDRRRLEDLTNPEDESSRSR
ncbi:MAG: RNA-binding S4 domain-containing protein [Burkholderiales bacterium]